MAPRIYAREAVQDCIMSLRRKKEKKRSRYVPLATSFSCMCVHDSCDHSVGEIKHPLRMLFALLVCTMLSSSILEF